MKAFYKVSITKQPDGSAIVHREPPLQGEIVTKVTDINTAGDFKIIVVECSEAQHSENLAYPAVTELEEEAAVKLAARYQPQRTVTRPNPDTGEEETVEQPAVDLRRLIQSREASGGSGRGGAGNSPAKKKRRTKKKTGGRRASST
jgi:hypothetical protein